MYISHTIHDPHLEFYKNIENIAPEETVSQIFVLVDFLSNHIQDIFKWNWFLFFWHEIQTKL